MTSIIRRSSHAPRPSGAKAALRRSGPYRRLVTVPPGLRRLARAASPEPARSVSEVLSVTPSWLQPRFPLVNALLHELFRLERYGTLSDFYRPPRVSHGHRSARRKPR